MKLDCLPERGDQWLCGHGAWFHASYAEADRCHVQGGVVATEIVHAIVWSIAAIFSRDRTRCSG